MAELKTKEHDANVMDFIDSFTHTEKMKQDSVELLQLMQAVSGYEPKMWGNSIIGFGKYHYKSERSQQQGDWPLIGFSPRKAAISLYVYDGCDEQDELLKKLGKFKMGKACIYVKKLSDINKNVLAELIESTIRFLQNKYPIS